MAVKDVFEVLLARFGDLCNSKIHVGEYLNNRWGSHMDTYAQEPV